jgi:Golgi nucleoside diphosphatase
VITEDQRNRNCEAAEGILDEYETHNDAIEFDDKSEVMIDLIKNIYHLADDYEINSQFVRDEAQKQYEREIGK